MNEEYGKERISRIFGRDAARFVEHAAALGWRILFNSTGTSITLVPYDDGAKRIHLSSRNKNSGALRKHIKTLVKHADPEKVKIANDLISSNIPDDAKALLFAAQGEAELMGSGGISVMEPELEKPAKQITKAAKPKEVAPVKAPANPTAIPTPKQVAERVTQERRILSERPALMHYTLTQEGGKSYPSQTTLERRWSDGSVDYACAAEPCDATSENRRAFGGAHWAMHVRKGEAKPVDDNIAKSSIVDDPTYTEPAWSRKQTLREKRAAELKAMLEGLDFSKLTADELAAEIMEFLGDQGGGGGGSREPLTDAQVLDRIRTLVDRGTYAEQEKAIFERDRQIEDLMTYSQDREAALQAKLLEAEQRAIQAQATMNAFYDLVQEMKPGEESA